MKAKTIFAVGLVIVVASWVCATGCEKSGGSISDNETGSDSDGDADGDDDDDANGDDDGFEDDDNEDDDDFDTESEEICELEEIDINKILSRVMVLQDISGSMVTDENGNPVEKWNQAKAAITSLAEKYELEVDLGLDFFPDGSGDMFSQCGVDDPVISDTAPQNAQAIINSLNAAQPSGSTPLYVAMKKFTEPNYAPQFTADGANGYLLVVSDGADTCGINPDDFFTDPVTPADLTQVTTTLLNDHEISTFVIGFGEGVAPEQLNAIAAAGGTEFTEYLVADDQQSLEEAFEAIVSTLVSCIYELEVNEPNVDPEKVNFYFITLDDDGNEVETTIPYDEDCDAGKGWHWVDFDNFIVEFCKEACEMLQTGDVIKIIAEFGCEVIVV